MLQTQTPTTPNYALWQTEALTPDTTSSHSIKSILEHLVILSHLAPSTHNTQPWRYRLDEYAQTITVYVDRTMILPASDTHGQQTLVSMGACLTNLLIGSRYLGYGNIIALADIDSNAITPYSDGEDRYTYIATISLQTTTPETHLKELYEAIFTRMVMRIEFDQTQLIPADIITSMKKIAEDHTVQAHMITDPVRRQGIAEFQGQADGYVINSKAFATELGDWLLPNNTDSYIGMPGMGFGLQDDEAVRMHKGLLGQTALEPEDGLRFATGGKMSIEKSPLICCITGKKNEPHEWIKTGMAWEEMFLMLHAADYCVAMHAGIVEVPLINRMFAATLGTTRRPMCLFRVGKPKREKDKERSHSPRLPLEQIILS